MYLGTSFFLFCDFELCYNTFNQCPYVFASASWVSKTYTIKDIRLDLTLCIKRKDFNMIVTYLQHSGILVENETHQLFFDVISDITSLINFDKKIFFCVSHSHSDHFVKSKIMIDHPKVTYVFSEDVPREGFENVFVLAPLEKVTLDGIVFKAYASSDLGNAYTIYFDEKTLFFAGDLNWWHWENNSEQANRAEEKLFKEIVATIDDRVFDLAFIPVDPRQGKAYHITGDYFLEQFEIAHFIPIHFGAKFDITKQFKAHRNSEEKVICISNSNTQILTL